MTAWVAVGLIGGGTAFASRLCSLSRLIGAGMIVAGGMVLAAPAFADEHVLAKDNSEVACTMSKSGLTRVSLKDDRFASVSKLTTGVDTDDFTVVNEPTRGDIYVSVPEAYSRPNVSFFGTTSKGYVYKFSCRLAGDDAQQVFVENKDIGGAAETQVAAVAASPQEASATLVQAMFQSAPLEGFEVRPAVTDPVMIGSLKVQMVAEYRGASLAGRTLRIENRGKVPVALGEGTIAPSNAIAVSVAKALLIDEAWQMLRGGSMADFVETYSRTCRKYGASLITATQSLNDYYKSEGSLAALENSDWSVILMQKPDTISDFQKHGRFDMDPYTESLLRSLKRNGAEYSDILIKGPESMAVGRLVLDKYSATLYSSSPQTFADIEHLIDLGCSMDEAIERVAFPEEYRDNPPGEPWVEAAE